jgi:hypothetical protein
MGGLDRQGALHDVYTGRQAASLPTASLPGQWTVSLLTVGEGCVYGHPLPSRLHLLSGIGDWLASQHDVY